MLSQSPFGGGPAEELFFRDVVEHIPQMVWTKNAQGLNEFCNERFRQFMGISHEDFVHNSWIIAHPDDVARGQEAWRKAFSSGGVYEVELRLRPKHFPVFRWFLVRAVPYCDDTGKVVRWFGTTTDIDAQKRYTEQQEETVRVLVDLFSPGDLPRFKTLLLDAVYLPVEDMARIGGDFYEACELEDGRLLVAIGDVAGHGLQAAVTMERVRSSIVSACIDFRGDPARVLAKVNRMLFLRRQPTLVTAIVGIVDPHSGTFQYASAGHCVPLLVRTGCQPRGLRHGGVPLGTTADPVFPAFEERLERDDLLVLYTDGLTEADRDYAAGEQRLMDAASSIGPDELHAAHAIQQAICSKITPADDIAVLTLTYRPVSTS